MRTLPVCLLLLFIGLLPRSGWTQTLYEIDYHYEEEGGQDRYRAFIIRYDDGTGLTRVKFTDSSGQELLVEMDMQEEYGRLENGEEDTSLLIFTGIRPRFIRGNDSFIPDHFVFQLGTDGFYEPYMVIAVDEDGQNESTGILDEVRLLDQKDLTREWVLEFFNEDEDFFTGLFTTTTRGLTQAEKSTRLLLLIVANTNDKTIGPTCVIDRDNMTRTFSEIAEFLEIGFTPTIISGADFSKARVDKAINDLRPSPRDIVVFYYTGHGFNYQNQSYTFPYLDLRDKSFQAFGGAYTLNIEAVYQKIKLKGARLNLVLTDCCNNDPSQTSQISQETPSTRTSSIGWNKEKCLALFMNPARLSILMTAARKGELSAGNTQDGGFFSSHFRQTLEKSISLASTEKQVGWESILQNARTQTTARANRTLCRMPDESLRRCLQNPVFIIEK